jgi:long-chain acyl-CoA synthetase
VETITRLFDLLHLYRGPLASQEVVFAGKLGGKWRSFSANDYCRISDQVSASLLEAGVGKGTKVATIMQNCPEWNFLDMGLLQIGAVQVPIYPTICNEHFRYLFEHADVEYVFIYDNTNYKCISAILPEFPAIKGVISIRHIDGVTNWNDFLEQGSKNADPEKIRTISDQIKPNDLATIIYTSGTTGTGKGVMLTHNNFVSNFIAAQTILAPKAVETALSFLPLCHVYERMLNYVYQYLGISVYYAGSIENLDETIREVRPQIICAVPRMLEKIFDRIVVKGRGLHQPRKAIFMWALRLAVRYQLYGAKGLSYELRRKLADVLVYRKWRQALGGRLRYVVSGGASLRPRIARVFWAAGIQVVEGYGLTETSPVVAVGTFEPEGMKFGTVGPPLKGVEVKIAEDGEILCRGPNVMLGYYKDEALTREVIAKDGWFHTGDIGTLDEGKYVKITDRKKEIFKTSGGKYIAPQVIENRFKESEFIENILVAGENRHFAAALIVPAFEHLKSWCEVKNIEYSSNEQIVRHPEVMARYGREVDRINLLLDKTEQIRKFRLMGEEWNVHSGELSPTLKLRRKFILKKYAGMVNDIYREQRIGDG